MRLLKHSLREALAEAFATTLVLTTRGAHLTKSVKFNTYDTLMAGGTICFFCLCGIGCISIFLCYYR